jgi:hypothetical protein
MKHGRCGKLQPRKHDNIHGSITGTILVELVGQKIRPAVACMASLPERSWCIDHTMQPWIQPVSIHLE